MSYANLYNQCQNLDISIKRTKVRDLIREITGQSIEFCMDGMDTKVLRGYWLKPSDAQNTKFRAINKNNGPIVVIARAQNRCWQRLVLVKEMMHIFDSSLQHTSSGSDFETLLNSLSSDVENPVEASPQSLAEHEAVYKALAVLCPQKHIEKFHTLRKQGKISDYNIALEFRIPEQYVPLIFDDSFSIIVNHILEN